MAINFKVGQILEPTDFTQILSSVETITTKTSTAIAQALTQCTETFGRAEPPFTVISVGRLSISQLDGVQTVLSYISFTDNIGQNYTCYFPSGSGAKMSGDDLLNKSFKVNN